MFFIFNFKGTLVNQKVLRALALVGPTWDNPVLDPLAVLHLDNRLYLSVRDFGMHVRSWYSNGKLGDW